jgi:hypothetical protein
VQGAFGRPHIATALLDHGYVPDTNTAFAEYLIPCNVAKYFMPADEAMALVRQARGLTSVAHPRFITEDRRRLQQVMQELTDMGLDGIEAYHSQHDAEEQVYFSRLATQRGLIITGGSDYHGFKTATGAIDSGGKLGSLQLPYGFAVRLRRAYLARYPLLVLLLHWPSTAAAALRRALEAHYQLASVRCAAAEAIASTVGHLTAEPTSRVIDLPGVDPQQLEAIVVAGARHGLRTVGLPWESAGAVQHPGLYLTRPIGAERVRQTALERLAHELVHAIILSQLR